MCLLILLLTGAQRSLLAGTGNTKNAESLDEEVQLFAQQNEKIDLITQRLCENIDSQNLEGVEHFLQQVMQQEGEVNWQTRYTFLLNHSWFESIPLCIAAARGNPRIFKRLVKAGADVNCKISSNNWNRPFFQTPLQTAAWCGHLDIVKYLIAQGADIHEPASCGETARSFANYRGLNEIKSLLDEFSTEKTPDQFIDGELKEIAQKRADN